MLCIRPVTTWAVYHRPGRSVSVDQCTGRPSEGRRRPPYNRFSRNSPQKPQGLSISPKLHRRQMAIADVRCHAHCARLSLSLRDDRLCANRTNALGETRDSTQSTDRSGSAGGDGQRPRSISAGVLLAGRRPARPDVQGARRPAECSGSTRTADCPSHYGDNDCTRCRPAIPSTFPRQVEQQEVPAHSRSINRCGVADAPHQPGIDSHRHAASGPAGSSSRRPGRLLVQ